MKIDLMGNLPLTEAEIQARAQDTIEGAWPAWQRERALRLAVAGDVTQSNALDAYLDGISTLVDELRADSSLLTATLAYEAAERRLALPPYDGPAMIDGDEGQVPNSEAEQDAAERGAAQATIDGAVDAVLALAAQRSQINAEADNAPAL